MLCAWLLIAVDPRPTDWRTFLFHALFAATIVGQWMLIRSGTVAAYARVLVLLGTTALALVGLLGHGSQEAVLALAAAASFVLLSTPGGRTGATLSLAALVFAVLCALPAVVVGHPTPLWAMVAVGWLSALLFRRRSPESLAQLERDVTASVGADIALLEAQRRQIEADADVRIMHDTVLRTLTVIARRGAAVDAAVLRAMAEQDLVLLASRQFGPAPVHDYERAAAARAGAAAAVPGHGASAAAVRSTVEDRILSVAGAFSNPGFTVTVQGSLGQAGAGGASSDALCGALGECVVNAYKYAGTGAVDVLLSAGRGFLSVVVTDSGAGFEPATVPADRLGLRTSVVGRLESVGGRARIFSLPGVGTTIALEVPCAD